MVLLGLAAILILFSGLWAVSLRLENASIADVAWGPGILVIGLIYYFTSYFTGDGLSLRAHVTLALLAVWAIRGFSSSHWSTLGWKPNSDAITPPLGRAGRRGWS